MAKERIKESMRRAYALRAAMALHGWDQETYMPSGGGEARAQVLAELGSLLHRETTRPDLLEELREELAQEQDGDWLACVRAYARDCELKAALPASLDRALNETASLAQQAWSVAKNSGDAAAFLPLLEKMIGLKREQVSCQARPGLQGYDVLLDAFEPGMRSSGLDRVFAELHPGLLAILDVWRGQKTPAPLQGGFPPQAQQAYALDLLSRMGFDLEQGRLDVSAHPFTEGIAPGDVRLTTRFSAHDFLDSFYTVMHEGGHGLYEQGLDPAWRWTPLAEAVSLGVHESQSRFWENCIGRSREFWEGELPRARRFFPALEATGVEDMLARARMVRPSYIRVESDEVTYNLHIMLRYRVERDLFSGSLSIGDLQEAWNAQSEALLGLRPRTPAEGYLQDVHWSAGLFGYFPTYALGNLYAAQLRDAMRAAFPDYAQKVREGDWGKLLSWLRERVHKPGRSLDAPTLMAKATGQPLSAAPLIAYLRERYTP